MLELRVIEDLEAQINNSVLTKCLSFLVFNLFEVCFFENRTTNFKIDIEVSCEK